MLYAFLKKGCFQDSVSLMLISRDLSKADDVPLRSAAGRTGNDVHEILIQPYGAQKALCRIYFLYGVARYGYAHRVAYAVNQERAERSARLDYRHLLRPRLGDAYMQGVIAPL